MALSSERKGEIAFLLLMDKLRSEGVSLKPKEVRREVINRANKFHLSFSEMREFTEVVLRQLFDETMRELGQLPSSDPLEIS